MSNEATKDQEKILHELFARFFGCSPTDPTKEFFVMNPLVVPMDDESTSNPVYYKISFIAGVHSKSIEETKHD
jgi:hypothetical protein